MSQDGETLGWASPELRGDRDIVVKAVAQSYKVLGILDLSAPSPTDDKGRKKQESTLF